MRTLLSATWSFHWRWERYSREHLSEDGDEGIALYVAVAIALVLATFLVVPVAPIDLGQQRQRRDDCLASPHGLGQSSSMLLSNNGVPLWSPVVTTRLSGKQRRQDDNGALMGLSDGISNMIFNGGN